MALTRWRVVLALGIVCSCFAVLTHRGIADIGGNATTGRTRLRILTRGGPRDNSRSDTGAHPVPKGLGTVTPPPSACRGRSAGVARVGQPLHCGRRSCALGNDRAAGAGTSSLSSSGGRWIDAGTPVAGAAGVWDRWRYTCLPELVPGAGRALTMAMIRDAFHDTDFSVPDGQHPARGRRHAGQPADLLRGEVPRGRLRPRRGRHPRPRAPARLPHRGAPAAEVDHLPPRHHDDRAHDVPGWPAPDG